MPQALIVQGLELFAKGDVAGALRVWLQARRMAPHDPQLVAYVEHIRATAPEVFAAIDEEEAGAGVEVPSAWPQAAALAPPLPPPTQMATSAEVRLPMPLPIPPAELGAADPWTQSTPEQPAAAVQVESTAVGLELVEPPVVVAKALAQPEDPAVLAPRLAKLLELDDFSGALEVAEQILATAPGHEEAQKAMQHCRGMLEKIYQSKLGDSRAVPTVRLPPGEVIWLDLDHRAGFVLAQVDGVSSYDEIIEITGMDRLESLRILAQLCANGVIGTE